MLLEELLYESIVAMLGPMICGLVVMLFFLALGIILRLEPDAFIAEMIGASFLIFVFIPELRLIAGIAVGILISLGILALVRR